MDKVKVFIDHFGRDEDAVYAKSLKIRLSSVSPQLDVRAFDDIPPSPDDDESSEESEGSYSYWIIETLKEISEAQIVIPIVTSRYLPYVEPDVEEAFGSIMDSDDRYLLPILYSPVNWGKINWMVRGKLFPSDGVPIVERTAIEADKVVNDLVLTLEGILSTLSSNSDAAGKVQEKLRAPHGVVFISHDHDDADFAELLKLRLDKEGVESWIDSERLKIGQDWREEIDGGIENSLAVIVVVTPEARKSEYVTYEWAYAWGKGKRVFPLMLKQTQLHPRLESLQYLDFTNRAARPWEDLISSIKELL